MTAFFLAPSTPLNPTKIAFILFILSFDELFRAVQISVVTIQNQLVRREIKAKTRDGLATDMKNDDDEGGRPPIRTETKYNVVSCYFCNEFIDSSDFKVKQPCLFTTIRNLFTLLSYTTLFLCCSLIKFQTTLVLHSRRGVLWHEMKVNFVIFPVVTPR